MSTTSALLIAAVAVLFFVLWVVAELTLLQLARAVRPVVEDNYTYAQLVQARRLLGVGPAPWTRTRR